MDFLDNAGSNDDSTRYGRFAIAPNCPHWEVFAWRNDLKKFQYTGLRFYRKQTAMKVAQGMMLAERQHWGTEEP